MHATMRATIARYDMFPAGQTVVVGVSGGPDSTALLHALAGLRGELGIDLVAAHLNHGFRGDEAEADAAYVHDLAAGLGIRCWVERVDVPGMRKRLHLSAQEVARNARHAFLKRVASELGATRIALGHTQNDRIETVLLNLLRGCGPDGLAGFPPIDLPLVRPLYAVSRAETEAYCADHALNPRRDSSNASFDYRRNRLRTELLPYLMSYYNQKVGNAILRMAGLVSADNTLLDALAAESREQVTLAQTDTGITLDAEALNELPPALRRRVVRQAIARVRGHLQGIGFEMLERVLDAVSERKKVRIDLPSSGAEIVRLRGDGVALTVVREAAASRPLPWQCLVQVPGRTELARAGIVLEASIGTADALRSGERRSDLLIYRCEDVTLPILARSWKPGDRMRPNGMSGSKKLQDLFTDAKVPSEERMRYPVLVDAAGAGRILAVVGMRADETEQQGTLQRPEALQRTDRGADRFLILRREQMAHRPA